jgi:hypothetical protein
LSRGDLLRAKFRMVSRKWLFKALFLYGVVYGAWNWYTSPIDSWTIMIISVLAISSLVTGAAIVVVFLITAPLLLLTLRKTPGVLGAHEFEITADGLREVTTVSEIRVARGSAWKVIRMRSFLIAMIDRRCAFIFPRHAFASAAAYDEFWNALQPLAGKMNS